MTAEEVLVQQRIGILRDDVKLLKDRVKLLEGLLREAKELVQKFPHHGDANCPICTLNYRIKKALKK